MIILNNMDERQQRKVNSSDKEIVQAIDYLDQLLEKKDYEGAKQFAEKKLEEYPDEL